MEESTERHWSQDESIKRWMAERFEEKRLKEAYRAVYDDMQNAARSKAFARMPEEARSYALVLIEQALRLAYCCTLGGEKAPAFISSHEKRFCDTFVSTIGKHSRFTKIERTTEYAIAEGWGILWRSENELDGKREYLIGEVFAPKGDELPVIKPAGEAQTTLTFKMRKEAEAFIKDRFGYIAKRPDLRAEPHGWKMPKPIRVRVCVQHGDLDKIEGKPA